MDLKNKTAVITGGSSGIGQAIASKFLDEGAKVFNLDLRETSIEHEQLHFFQCDVSDQAQVSGFINLITQNASINILVNNAGISHIGNIEETSEEDLQRLFDINVKGVVNCSKACIKEMKKNGHGVILNIASIGALVGLKDRFAYSMSKGAVLAMTYSIARDYLEYDIRCNSISPARIHTPFVDGFLKKNYPGREQEEFKKLEKTQPIGRMGKPEEVAELACFLCSDKAKFITGTDYPVDGGFLKLNT